MQILNLHMLATYTTFLHANRFLQGLLQEHRRTHNTLKLVAIPEEDFLSVLRKRRKELNLRHTVLSEKIVQSINESKSLLAK